MSLISLSWSRSECPFLLLPGISQDRPVSIFRPKEKATAKKKFKTKNKKDKKTYNSGYSLVVTDPTTNPPLSGLTLGERTGSRIFR